MTAYNIDSFGWAFAAEIARRNGDEAARKACEREEEKAAERERAEYREFMRRLRYSNVARLARFPV